MTSSPPAHSQGKIAPMRGDTLKMYSLLHLDISVILSTLRVHCMAIVSHSTLICTPTHHQLEAHL